jgi:hypothetical protein
MRDLIIQIRRSMPLGEDRLLTCAGPCQGCALKLLDYLDGELLGWESRLDQGERPGLVDLSRLQKSALKIQSVLLKNGFVLQGDVTGTD